MFGSYMFKHFKSIRTYNYLGLIQTQLQTQTIFEQLIYNSKIYRLVYVSKTPKLYENIKQNPI